MSPFIIIQDYQLKDNSRFINLKLPPKACRLQCLPKTNNTGKSESTTQQIQ